MSYTRFLTVVALVASLVAIGLSAGVYLKLTDEAEGRRDQSCRISETQHKADVDGLRRTYKYLAALTPRQRRTTINRAILANLPVAEREARLDPAPPFCDEPGVGLPEPDPVLPRRPHELNP